MRKWYDEGYGLPPKNDTCRLLFSFLVSILLFNNGYCILASLAAVERPFSDPASLPMNVEQH